MRNPQKLEVYALADALTIKIYRITKGFPKDELFGLSAQMRRAAVSVVCNIVEGCARNTSADYLHFLDMAYGSAAELQYQASLASRLGYLAPEDHEVKEACLHVNKALNGLVRSLRRP